MPRFKTVHRVPYSAEQMFAVVADVEQYPQFLPLCESLQVLSRRDVAGGSELTATMGIGYKSIRETFTTKVDLRPAENRIVVAHVDGPFRKLENIWTFIPAEPAGSDVDFDITYEFRSPMLAVLMGAVFDSAFRKFSAAFEQRAQEIYGPAA